MEDIIFSDGRNKGHSSTINYCSSSPLQKNIQEDTTNNLAIVACSEPWTNNKVSNFEKSEEAEFFLEELGKIGEVDIGFNHTINQYVVHIVGMKKILYPRRGIYSDNNLNYRYVIGTSRILDTAIRSLYDQVMDLSKKAKIVIFMDKGYKYVLYDDRTISFYCDDQCTFRKKYNRENIKHTTHKMKIKSDEKSSL